MQQPALLNQTKEAQPGVSLSSVRRPKLSLETIRKMMCLQRRTRSGKEAALNHPRPSSLLFPSLLQGTLSYACLHASTY